MGIFSEQSEVLPGNGERHSRHAVICLTRTHHLATHTCPEWDQGNLHDGFAQVDKIYETIRRNWEYFLEETQAKQVKMVANTTLLIFNQHLKSALATILTGITDTQMLYSEPQIDERNIRDVAIHAYRPLLAVAYTVAGETWPARPNLPTTIEELQTLLATMAEQVETLLARLQPEMLSSTVVLPWAQQMNGHEAIIDSLVHGLIHTGTLQGIRSAGGFSAPAETAH